MTRFMGITREPVFSPGKVDADRTVIELVAEHLRRGGQCVEVVDGDDWPEPTADTVVFAMCQGPRALARLAELEARGLRIINRPAGILNCQRHHTVARFAGTDIAFPETVLLDTAGPVTVPTWVETAGAWIKRGDVHATDAGDVAFVDHAAGVRAAIVEFHARGIRRAVVQRHAVGTVLKFYGVRGRFFHCVPPAEAPAPPPDVLARIDALGARAADLLDVEVYGGDCVWDRMDGLQLIDLNDWPSYGACRLSAAKEIAAYLASINHRILQ